MILKMVASEAGITTPKCLCRSCADAFYEKHPDVLWIFCTFGSVFVDAETEDNFVGPNRPGKIVYRWKKCRSSDECRCHEHAFGAAA
jgi:hypothetical protein